MQQLILMVFLLQCLPACTGNAGSKAGITTGSIDIAPPINPYTHIKSIPLPEGYKRIAGAAGSFEGFLRNIPLQKQTTVYLYNGRPKSNQQAQYAVLQVSVGDKDLQQCADAVMRLRAEFLFAEKRFDEIVFYDNNKTPYKLPPPFTRTNFTIYLDRVFGMCGSASLAKQLKPVSDFTAILPGDVIIRGGFPGHAVMVMDVAVNEAGEKIYLLAQSYMPAQDIHVLVNPTNAGLSPWYPANGGPQIQTPEYHFTKNELRRW